MCNLSSICKLGSLLLCLLFFSAPTNAGQWKPLCLEGSSCSVPYQSLVDGTGPFVSSDGIWLLHDPIEYDEECVVIPRSSCFKNSAVFRLSSSGIEDLGEGFGSVSDSTTVKLPDGLMMNFGLLAVGIWNDPTDEIEWVNWSGQDWLSVSHDDLISSPIVRGDIVYVGLEDSGGGSTVFKSTNQGITWEKIRKSHEVPEAWSRFNLLSSPENDAFWFIHSHEYDHSDPSLWESTDEGRNWLRIDDGSFPVDTLRVVHDPNNMQISYALAQTGLFISQNRGVTWEVSSLTDAVTGLVFIDRDPPLHRVLAAGTDVGVKVSFDEGVTWQNMSRGLVAQPYSVTYGHDQFIATSDSGYFTCNAMDCFGPAQSMPSEEERGLVEVVEFYNTHLDHYFITGTAIEAEMIDEGKAGPGWIRTGESFWAWSLGGLDEALDVCRFYGSLNPGPNSHFYSVSSHECRFQMDLQELIPNDKPRWNFEGYAFSVLPASTDEQMPCPNGTIPVYRAYNDGYGKGEDSNHRYVTNLSLMDEMVAKGWVDEGVAFCSPTN